MTKTRCDGHNTRACTSRAVEFMISLCLHTKQHDHVVIPTLELIRDSFEIDSTESNFSHYYAGRVGLNVHVVDYFIQRAEANPWEDATEREARNKVISLRSHGKVVLPAIFAWFHQNSHSMTKGHEGAVKFRYERVSKDICRASCFDSRNHAFIEHHFIGVVDSLQDFAEQLNERAYLQRVAHGSAAVFDHPCIQDTGYIILVSTTPSDTLKHLQSEECFHPMMLNTWERNFKAWSNIMKIHLEKMRYLETC